ncbi:MAG: hypothetical protein K2I46_07215, partial [Clostridia bacterium]|nr:hypothetical protein [Clostridia bacterium]
PKNSVINCVFSQKCLPSEIDSTYDRPAVDNLQFQQNYSNVSVKFSLNPKLCYKIFKRDFLKGETLLYDIKNGLGDANYQIDVDSFFGNTITVIPYYIDDDANEILGAPNKYNSSGAFSRIK